MSLTPELENHVIDGLVGKQWLFTRDTVRALYHEIIELREHNRRLNRPCCKAIGGEVKFRTKPVLKEAFRYNIDYRPDWFQDKVSDQTIITFEDFCNIATLEGIMRAEKGDWIIQGLRGEIYPCKPDIFEKTYERAE